MKRELIIQHNQTLYQPVVAEGIIWETVRKGSPGKLTFSVVKDDILNFEEGDIVSFRENDENIFKGFVFEKSRNKNNIINVVAYDQLRYLKNKDSLKYENKTADQLIRMLAADYNLKCGALEPTKVNIAYRLESDQTLFDIIQTALDLTLQSSGQLFVFFDDFGELSLSSIENMRIDILLDGSNVEDFNYTSSIDKEVYNMVKLTHVDDESGQINYYWTKDPINVAKWGRLQYTADLDSETNYQATAESLLNLYNQKSRTLELRNCLGYSPVRAGTSIAVLLNLGDISQHSYLLVEKAVHHYNQGQHLMDLTLRGGLITDE